MQSCSCGRSIFGLDRCRVLLSCGVLSPPFPFCWLHFKGYKQNHCRHIFGLWWCFDYCQCPLLLASSCFFFFCVVSLQSCSCTTPPLCLVFHMDLSTNLSRLFFFLFFSLSCSPPYIYIYITPPLPPPHLHHANPPLSSSSCSYYNYVQHSTHSPPQ